MGHGFVDGTRPADRNPNRIGECEAGDGIDLGWDGGGEEKGLPLFWAETDNGLHIVNEAHVEHAVDFVEHEHLQVIQAQGAFLQKIHQAADRGDDDIAAFVERIALGPVTDAAVNQRGLQIGELAEFAEGLVDLSGEFAGRFQHEDARRGEFMGPEPVQDGQSKSCGFTGAGLRGGNKISPTQDHGDGLLLNGRGFAIAFGGDGTNDTGIETELVKRHGANAGVKSLKREGKTGLGQTPSGRLGVIYLLIIVQVSCRECLDRCALELIRTWKAKGRPEPTGEILYLI